MLWDGLPTVSVYDKDWLELPLILAKFSEALYLMPPSRPPGMDRLIVDFYHVFWDVLGPDLTIIWAESEGIREPHLSYRQAVLALLPKMRDLHDLQNWRPLLLLSMDYKVVSEGHLTVTVVHVGGYGPPRPDLHHLRLYHL